MKTIDRKFTNEELSLIASLLSQHGGQLADENDNFIGSKKWKELWALQDYFNQLYNTD